MSHPVCLHSTNIYASCSTGLVLFLSVVQRWQLYLCTWLGWLVIMNAAREMGRPMGGVISLFVFVQALA